MARPVKEGLDYFPLDTFLDTKFELIEAEFGLQGFAIIVKLFQKIYGERGYYCEWTNEVALLFSRRSGGGKVVSEIVQAAIRRGIFNADMFDKYSILTSKGIQERYFDAVNRRTNVKAISEYLLISATQISENVTINGINVDINFKNGDTNTQSKVNKSKVNKSKVNKKVSKKVSKKERKNPTDQLTDQQESLDNCLAAYEKYIGIATSSVLDGLTYCVKHGMETNLIIRIIEYVSEQGEKKRNWQYLKAVLMGNLNDNIKTLQEYSDTKKKSEKNNYDFKNIEKMQFDKLMKGSART